MAINIKKILTGVGLRAVVVAVLAVFLVFVATFSLMSSSVEAAVLRRPPNNLNLKAYWSFNDGSGTIATDFSRNYATGTLTNMEAADWVNGKLDSALSFDGVNERVAIGSGLSSISGNPAFTMCAWINTGSVSTAQAIFATGNTGSALAAAGIFLNNGANGAFSMEFAGGNTARTAGGVITANTWYHVCGVKTAGAINTTTTLYVNGQSVALAGGASTGTPNISTTAASIGSFTSNGSYFSGKIDEVRVYNSALSAANILALYRSGSVSINASQNSRVTNGLVALWSFDGPDMINGVATDRSGQGNNAFKVEMATATAHVPGKIGQALRFDGVDDYVYAPTSANYDFADNDFTVAWWEYRTSNDNGRPSIARTSQGPSDYTPFLLGFSAGGSDLYIYMSSNNGGWDIASGNTMGPVTLNAWNHFVIRRNGDLFTAHKNGVQTDSWSSSSPLASGGVGDLSLTIGRYFSAVHYYFQGIMDDVRIYNRAINTKEMAQLYAAGQNVRMNASQNARQASGLVGLWSFDGPDMVAGTTAYDRSGSGYDGTLSGMTAASAVPGRVGQALYFDGSDDVISIANLDAHATRSVSFWMKRDRDPANFYEGIIGCSAPGGWGIGISPVGNGSTIFDSVLGSSSHVSTAGITDQEWHHIVETRGNGTIQFYIDGVLDSSQADTDVHDCSAALYQIGNHNNNSPMFKGTLDDLRLYNKVLTAAEVSAIYNRTK